MLISKIQILLASCVLTACTSALAQTPQGVSKNPNARYNYNNAVKAMGVHNFRAAMVAINRSIAFDPTDSLAIYLRGRLLEEMDENEKAIADFEQAFKINSRNASASDYYWAASANFRENHVERGQQLLEMGIKLYPNAGVTSCMLFNRRGMRESMAGKDDAALKDFNRAISLSDSYQSPRMQRARLYVKHGQYQKAIEDYTYVINKSNQPNQSDSDISSSLKNRAECYGKLGKKDLQAADLKRLKEFGNGWATDLLK